LAIDTGDQDHGRAAHRRGQLRLGRPEPPQQLGADRVEHHVGLDHPGPQPGIDIGSDRRGRRRPHVGLDERRVELAEEVVVDQPSFPLEEVANIGRQHLGRLGEAGLEPIQQSHQSLSLAFPSATSRPTIPATNRGDDSPP
jgi:hypothetical protein